MIVIPYTQDRKGGVTDLMFYLYSHYHNNTDEILKLTGIIKFLGIEYYNERMSENQLNSKVESITTFMEKI